MRHYSKLIGGILLVAGTATGAGMLALPVSTGIVGILPTVILFVFCWAYMLYTAFLMLEVNLWMGEGVNLFTMAKNTLGRTGEIICCAAYLFLLYFLTAAYLAGSGPIISDFVGIISGYSLAPWIGALFLLLFFSFFVYEGTSYVDLINRWLMVGLIITYVLMMALITPNVDHNLLKHSEWTNIVFPLSLVVTSFGFHVIIPTLTTYMHRHVSHLKMSFVIGSLVPLMVYIIWDTLALGIIPIHGEDGIISGYKADANGVQLLTNILASPTISVIAQAFSFFAIVTSFLGVTMGLTDFLADGLGIKKKSVKGRVILYVLTFVPPFIFIITYPRAFLTALEYAGAFGVVILLGILPALMTWSGRYYKRFPATYRTPGGKPALIAVIVISLFIIVTEILIKTHVITPNFGTP